MQWFCYVLGLSDMLWFCYVLGIGDILRFCFVLGFGDILRFVDKSGSAIDSASALCSDSAGCSGSAVCLVSVEWPGMLFTNFLGSINLLLYLLKGLSSEGYLFRCKFIVSPMPDKP